MMTRICVVGLGYVGLPLAIQFARSNVSVVGLDTDKNKVDLIQNGQSYIKHIAAETIASMLETKRLSASTDFHNVKGADAVIICVPSPLNKNREPDISYILDTGQMIAPHLSKGALVVLESTTYPATTDEDLRQVLEQGSGRKPALISISPFHPSARIPAIPKVGRDDSENRGGLHRLV